MNGRKTFLKSPCREKVVSAKNHFLKAGALMCVTRERYELSRFGLHHDMQQRVHFTMGQYFGM